MQSYQGKQEWELHMILFDFEGMPVPKPMSRSHLFIFCIKDHVDQLGGGGGGGGGGGDL